MSNYGKLKTRSPTVAALATLLMFGFSALSIGQVVLALVNGRTRFPARWNEIYVSWDANPGWFAASLIAWMAMSGFFAHLTLLCAKQVMHLWRR